MLELVKQIIKYYIENNKKIPTKNELDIIDMNLLESKWNIFVTLYKNGNIVWNSWNIVEIENDLVNELIQNTVYALNDNRFPDLTIEEIPKISIRIDQIENRVLLSKKIEDLNPVKTWILVIKKDYSKLSIILPNISPTISSWSDFIPVLSKKLDEEFKQENFIIFEIETKVITNY